MKQAINPLLLFLSAATLSLSLIAPATARAQQNLPPIVGSELPGTEKFTVDISIDGQRIDVTGFNRGGFIPDADGDGIVEAYLTANEPGQACQTLVYIPSRQARSVAIRSDALSDYTRVRNFGAVSDNSEQSACPDSSARLRNVGDLNGDGIDEISTQYNYNGELIFDGAVAYGTLIDAADPEPGVVTNVEDDLELNPVGDFNGDGLVDWYMYSYAEAVARRDECLVIASQSGPLRAAYNFDAIDDDTLLASFTRNGNERCPSLRGLGDVNGDGIGDITLFDDFLDEQWVIHGDSARVLGDSYRDEGYRIFRTCNYDECQQTLDVDADGYDDVLMEVSGLEHDSLLDGTGSLIVYGGPEGLVSADAIDPLPAERLTQIVPKYSRPRASGSRTTQPERLGDINGDGASDLLLSNAIGSYELAGSIMFGTPGRRPAVFVESSIDGGNGVQWVESNAFYGTPGPGDFNGDGFDDLTYISTVMAGSVALSRAADPRDVFLFHGPDSLDARWQAPEDTSNLLGYVLQVNGQDYASMSPDLTSFRITQPSSGPIEELRIQSKDRSGALVGEAVRQLVLTPDELATQQQRLGDVEFTARGDRIDAEAYTLTGKTYGPSFGELFWNTTKRFVLVWHDGQIIDRVEGNSYMVNDHGEYFITIDYLGDTPQDYVGDTPQSGSADVTASGTLRRSNIVTIAQAGQSDPSIPSRPVIDILPTAPANLSAQVYSASTAELFWDRASPGENIISYDIDRDGVRIGSTDGTSFMDGARLDGQRHIYSVTAIDRSDLRSTTSVVTTEAFHLQGDTESPNDGSTLPLTGLVYSSTAIELFWNTDGLSTPTLSRFEVLQNGARVTTSDGRSYFSDTLSPGTPYRFQLVGLDASGTQIVRSNELMLTTSGSLHR